jgi:hypothetical protein
VRGTHLVCFGASLPWEKVTKRRSATITGIRTGLLVQQSEVLPTVDHQTCTSLRNAHVPPVGPLTQLADADAQLRKLTYVLCIVQGRL